MGLIRGDGSKCGIHDKYLTEEKFGEMLKGKVPEVIEAALLKAGKDERFKGDKGDPGEKGDKGDPGSDYVLTDADKAEIAGMVNASGADWLAKEGEPGYINNSPLVRYRYMHELFTAKDLTTENNFSGVELELVAGKEYFVSVNGVGEYIAPMYEAEGEYDGVYVAENYTFHSDRVTITYFPAYKELFVDLKENAERVSIVDKNKESVEIKTEYMPEGTVIIERANVGQTIIVEEIDENGVPTKWKAANFSSGGTGEKGDPGEKGDKGDPGSDYVLTEADKAEIAGMVNVSSGSGGAAGLEILPETECVAVGGEAAITSDIVGVYDGEKYVVKYNGAAYECTAFDLTFHGITGVAMGNLAVIGETDTGEPFGLVVLSADLVQAMGASVLVIPLDGSESIALGIDARSIGVISKLFDEKIAALM